ncbi:MAG: BMP family lipoprotein [Christensenellales bacterium]|jgi:basic membrane protein A
MKKHLAILLAVMMCAVLFAGCQQPPADPNEGEVTPGGEQPESGTYEIAMITDLGTIDDKSFNQGTWEGLKQYADDHNVTCKYYKPTEQSNDAYLAAIQLAVDGGAKIIATPGFLFEVPIYQAQDLYPDVNFILVDGNPNDGDFANGPTYRTEKNVVGITYAEEQSGFLAGYAAVKDGYTKLGFMGGMAVPAVIRFGYGFVQGADYAAQELGISGIEVKYHYTGGFDATPEAQSLAASWYNSGTEVIFACGGSVGNSVFAAAEANNGKAIGVDVDQSGESETVITSAMKGLGASVYQTLEDFYNGKFPGGQSIIKDASNDGVGLPMETSRFNTFSQADYDAIYAKLVDGSVQIAKDTDVASAAELPLSVTSVTLVD